MSLAVTDVYPIERSLLLDIIEKRPELTPAVLGRSFFLMFRVSKSFKQYVSANYGLVFSEVEAELSRPECGFLSRQTRDLLVALNDCLRLSRKREDLAVQCLEAMCKLAERGNAQLRVLRAEQAEEDRVEFELFPVEFERLKAMCTYPMNFLSSKLETAQNKFWGVIFDHVVADYASLRIDKRHDIGSRTVPLFCKFLSLVLDSGVQGTAVHLLRMDVFEFLHAVIADRGSYCEGKHYAALVLTSMLKAEDADFNPHYIQITFDDMITRVACLNDDVERERAMCSLWDKRDQDGFMVGYRPHLKEAKLREYKLWEDSHLTCLTGLFHALRRDVNYKSGIPRLKLDWFMYVINYRQVCRTVVHSMSIYPKHVNFLGICLDFFVLIAERLQVYNQALQGMDEKFREEIHVFVGEAEQLSRTMPGQVMPALLRVARTHRFSEDLRGKCRRIAELVCGEEAVRELEAA